MTCQEVLMLVESTRSADLGRLLTAMAVDLREQIRDVREGVSVLNSSAAEISVTVSQVVSNTSTTSSAVMETSTTVDQLSQAAKLANEKGQRSCRKRGAFCPDFCSWQEGHRGSRQEN